MKIKLGQNDIFDCPEGKYRAILERVGPPQKLSKKPCKDQVRLTFRVETSAGKEHLVARTFCADLTYGGELYTFLESWLDGNFDPFLDECREIDLNLLVGKEADVLITHHDPGTHGKPFVNISGIFAPGRLVEQ